MTPPPASIANNPEACACFIRVQRRLLAMGKWEPIDEITLAPVASMCASYLRFAREVHSLENVSPENMRELEIGLERTHRLAREGLEQFLVIPPERVPLAAVNAEGLDAQIAALCAPLDTD